MGVADAATFTVPPLMASAPMAPVPFIVTTAPSAPAARVWDLDAVTRFAEDEGMPVEAVGDFDEALRRAASTGATTLVTGSFHTVGDAMARLQLSPLCG